MAKTKAETNETKKEYATIGEYFHDFLDNNECRIIKFVPYGTMYAANPKTKKPTRVSITLPSEICNTNLKELDNWVLIVVAIPREVVFPEGEQKGVEKNNVKSKR